jgi:hypothetical protein
LPAVSFMTAQDPLQAAIDAVTAASEKEGDVGAFAARLLPLLRRVARQTERRPARRDLSGPIEYAIESSTEGETLVERRLSGKSFPFRCPKQVYEALADVLAEAARPLSIDDLLGSVETKTGIRPAEFQVRVALRFWLYRQPPIVIRNRARYSATAVVEMRSAARGLWEKISR